jgi:adenylosuccinate synthase
MPVSGSWGMRWTVANTVQEDLPPQAQAYVKFVEEFTGVPVKWIGTGRKQILLFVFLLSSFWESIGAWN